MTFPFPKNDFHMQWVSALSQKQPLSEAIDELSSVLSNQLGDKNLDLVVVFVTPHFQNEFPKLHEGISKTLSPALMIGCTAGGVFGGAEEVEDHPAISITTAYLPGVTLHAFHIERDDLPDLDAGPSAWIDLLGVPQQPIPHFILLTDPTSFDSQNLLFGLDFVYSQSAKIGGIAPSPMGNTLFLNQGCHLTGAVGVAFQGNLEMDAIVAQGCRPIGTFLTIIRSQQSTLQELDERPALEVLTELYDTLSEIDQELVRTGLHLGIATTELQEEFKPADFLIRNVLDADQEQGTLAIGALLQNGQTVQFHVRDAKTSGEDLDLMLSKYSARPLDMPPSGALPFSCNGRGQRLYGRPNHDSEAFRRVLGQIPLGGFFCSGEIGPVGETTYIHGFTDVFGIFRPTSK